MANWTAFDGAIPTVATVADHAQNATVPVYSFPEPLPTGSRFSRDLGSGPAGTLWTVEGRVRLVGFHPDPNEQYRDMAVLRVVFAQDSNQYGEGVVRIGEGWQDFTFTWEQTTPGPVTLMWGLHATYRGIDVAADFIRATRSS